MARFQKGNTAGKKYDESLKGVRHGLKDLRWDVRKFCEERGFNPFEKMIEIATTSRRKSIQLKAAAELASYIAPKLKQVELTTNKDSMFQINFNLVPKPKEALEDKKENG